jgi:hypothetical protein
MFALALILTLLNSSPRSSQDPWKAPLSHGEDPSILKYLTNKPGEWGGVKDEKLLAHIQKSEIKYITFNRGGSTISLRLHFKDGSSAAFKPDQFHEATVPRYEIAAYRINRLLGFSRVPPATWRTITRKELFKKSKKMKYYNKKRILREVKFNKDGTINGEVSHWVPSIASIPLETLAWRSKWLSWLSPWDVLFKRQFIMAAQISNIILFDFIINNPDRFTGNNTLSTPNRKYLYFMDNTFSFYPNPKGSGMANIYMRRVKRFSKTIISRLKALNETMIKKELAKIKNPPWTILTNREIKGVLKRRDYLMAHIVKTIAQYGWGKCVVFP